MATLTKSERPKITIPLRPLDYALEGLAVFSLLLLFVVDALNYGQLSEQIPTHYNFNGSPDGFGSKITLWVLPVVGLVLYIFMTLINRLPESFNYLVKITPENAAFQYTLATRLIRTMKAFVMLLFAFLVWRTISIVNGEAEGLGSWPLLVVVSVTLGTTFFIILKSSANK